MGTGRGRGHRQGQRMFVAVVPPEQVRDHLADFLDARPGQPWVNRAQWHVTLAFCEAVAEHRIDELAERLATKAAARSPFTAALAGAGAFPDAARASVLWLGLEVDGAPATAAPRHARRDAGHSQLHRLAVSARAAAAAVGAPPDGRPFHPHLTLARLRPPADATRWLRVLDTYRGPDWEVDHLELVASFLGEGPGGRPRYATLARLPLGALP